MPRIEDGASIFALPVHPVESRYRPSSDMEGQAGQIRWSPIQWKTDIEHELVPDKPPASQIIILIGVALSSPDVPRVLYIEFLLECMDDCEQDMTTHHVPYCLITSVPSLTTIGRIDPIWYFRIGKCFDCLKENLFMDGGCWKPTVEV